jgi:hypothetical protein
MDPQKTGTGRPIFAWIQWQHRLLVLWEYYAENFLGFVQLESISILLKTISR